MQNKFEVFTVTEEIYEHFKNKAVTGKLIKKIIPNYMDYAEVQTIECDDIYQANITNKLNSLFSEGRFITTPEELTSTIYDIMCNEDGSYQRFSIILDNYCDFTVYSVKNREIKETDNQVLEKIRNSINDFKTKRKNQIKVSQDLSKQLLEIAGNETLMQELLKLREQIQVNKG